MNIIANLRGDGQHIRQIIQPVKLGKIQPFKDVVCFKIHNRVVPVAFVSLWALFWLNNFVRERFSRADDGAMDEAEERREEEVEEAENDVRRLVLSDRPPSSKSCGLTTQRRRWLESACAGRRHPGR